MGDMSDMSDMDGIMGYGRMTWVIGVVYVDGICDIDDMGDIPG